MAVDNGCLVTHQCYVFLARRRLNSKVPLAGNQSQDTPLVLLVPVRLVPHDDIGVFHIQCTNNPVLVGHISLPYMAASALDERDGDAFNWLTVVLEKIDDRVALVGFVPALSLCERGKLE